MKKVVILISGGGTTAEATIKAIKKNELTGLTPVVISSNKNAKGNERVRNLGIELHIIDKDDYEIRANFYKKLEHLLDEIEPDIISLQGWLLLIPKSIVQKYNGKIINQHPGPLDPGRPDFGGKGMLTPYRTNSARIAYVWATGEDAWTESDTHFVTEEFDKGGIIRTEKMTIPEKNKKITIQELRANPEELVQTTHEVQKMFYAVEHHNVIKSLQLFADGKVQEWKREKPLVKDEYVSILTDAKKLATELFPNYNL